MGKKSEHLVQTDDGSFTLKHHEHGEDYHSSLGALREAEELYIERSGFRAAMSQSNPVSVADIGLGLGYNALSTIAAWSAAENPPPLYLYSIEIQSDLVAYLASGQAEWQSAWSDAWKQWASALVFNGGAAHAKIEHESGAILDWHVEIGDAAHMALKPERPFNFIWQDAFSPTNNPKLWSTAWFETLKRNSASGAILMTYSVARVVRDALSEAGWTWQKIPGVGQKKHWLKALL